MANDLMVMNNEEQNNSFCTYVPQSKEDSVFLFNAVADPTYSRDEVMGKEIAVTNVYVETITVDSQNGEDGEKVEIPRIIFFDDKGESYAITGTCLVGDLKRIFMTFGMPSEWTEPLKLKIVDKPAKRGKIHKIVLC